MRTLFIVSAHKGTGNVAEAACAQTTHNELREKKFENPRPHTDRKQIENETNSADQTLRALAAPRRPNRRECVRKHHSATISEV